MFDIAYVVEPKTALVAVIFTPPSSKKLFSDEVFLAEDVFGIINGAEKEGQSMDDPAPVLSTDRF